MDNFVIPAKGIEELKLKGGEVVADFGAGSGFYTSAIAKKLLELGSGKVFAIDILPSMIEHLEKMAQREGLSNVHVIRGCVDQPSGSGLADNSCDALVLSNTLFQTDKKTDMMNEVHRVLREKGKAIVIDWSESFGHMGPTPEMVVRRADAELLAEGAGLRVIRRFESGAHHWGIVLEK